MRPLFVLHAALTLAVVSFALWFVAGWGLALWRAKREREGR